MKISINSYFLFKTGQLLLTNICVYNQCLMRRHIIFLFLKCVEIILSLSENAVLVSPRVQAQVFLRYLPLARYFTYESH